MAQQAQQLRCLRVPLVQGAMLVPNVAVAEVVRYQKPRPIPGSPEWLLGLFAWRDKHIPTVSFESLIGDDKVEVGPSTRIAVFNTISAKSEIEFYAVLTHGFPHLFQLGPEDIQPQEERHSSPLVQQQVLMGERPALIPDLEGIEKMLRTSGSR